MFYVKEFIRTLLLPFADPDGEFTAYPGTFKYKFLMWVYGEVQGPDYDE